MRSPQGFPLYFSLKLIHFLGIHLWECATHNDKKTSLGLFVFPSSSSQICSFNCVGGRNMRQFSQKSHGSYRPLTGKWRKHRGQFISWWHLPHNLTVGVTAPPRLISAVLMPELNQIPREFEFNRGSGFPGRLIQFPCSFFTHAEFTATHLLGGKAPSSPGVQLAAEKYQRRYILSDRTCARHFRQRRRGWWQTISLRPAMSLSISGGPRRRDENLAHCVAWRPMCYPDVEVQSSLIRTEPRRFVITVRLTAFCGPCISQGYDHAMNI